MSTFLDSIGVSTKQRNESKQESLSLEKLKQRATLINREPAVLERVLSKGGTGKVIAEIKRKSPSQGTLKEGFDVGLLARAYQAAGASAISILTEPTSFGGSLEDLKAVRNSSPELVLLQKDFIIDEYQIYEALLTGADAILLIVALLGEEKTISFQKLAQSIGLSCLVEVHTAEELQIAVRTGAKIIGVNNRDLHSLKVSLDVSKKLISQIPDHIIAVSESGINTALEMKELKSMGFDAFLIGSSFMRTSNPGQQLAQLMSEVRA